MASHLGSGPSHHTSSPVEGPDPALSAHDEEDFILQEPVCHIQGPLSPKEPYPTQVVPASDPRPLFPKEFPSTPPFHFLGVAVVAIRF